MRIFKLLSALLLYPESALLDALPQIHMELAGIAHCGSGQPAAGPNLTAPLPRQSAYARLSPLLNYLQAHDLITLQQNYVQTFDRTPGHSLHLFEHIHGESRERGQAMVDLLHEYSKAGWQMTGNDLPDYVPLFLEFLSTQDEMAHSTRLLGDAIHVLAHIGNKLQAGNGPACSPYACLFQVLQDLSPVAAEALTGPPVRDMDEVLETFGPSPEGIEPLLNPLARCGSGKGVNDSTVHPLIFQPPSLPGNGRPVRSA